MENQTPRLSIRIASTKRTHHLFMNNGTWYIHYTIHLPGNRKDRRRESLGTKDLNTACERRDMKFKDLGLPHQPHMECIQFPPPVDFQPAA